MTAKPRKPLLVNLTWAAVALLGLGVVYVLSYAPVYRWLIGTDEYFGFVVPVESMPAGYRPAEWVMDYTPLREPLLRWADWWGCGATMRVHSQVRVGMASLHRP